MTPPSVLRATTGGARRAVALWFGDHLSPATPQPMPRSDRILHVPLFFHQMSGFRGTPVFQSAPMNGGGTFTP